MLNLKKLDRYEILINEQFQNLQITVNDLDTLINNYIGITPPPISNFKNSYKKYIYDPNLGYITDNYKTEGCVIFTQN